ncbi:hypothetical protein [Actinoplanes sp. OR16]|uniref:hypothetical protein n=1 Tax=Actinoplanes sp. OR16 TaxID=946334 RepID=UPI0018D5325D|nr:hypothetical protein [Actinoplanes sp. OR16]
MTGSLVAVAHESTTGITGLGPVEDAHQLADAIRNQSWVDGVLGGAGVSLEALSVAIDPLGSVASWGVAWLMEHVQPLRDALDHLAGDADQVAAHAATWHNVATFMEATHHEYAGRLASGTAGWAGDAGDAYRIHAGEHLAVLDGIAAAAGGIASAVEGAGLLVAAVREIVRDLIANFVATLAVRLPQWLATEGLTLGIATPLVAGQVSTLVARWAAEIQRFIRYLLNSLRRLRSMLDDLTGIFDRLMSRAGRIAKAALGGPGKPPKPPEKPDASFAPPPIRRDRHGRLTNGTYTVSDLAMLRHLPGTAPPRKSVFLSGVHAEKAVLDAAAFADTHRLWDGDKAKVYVVNGPVRVLGRTGELTHYINVYRNERGAVHGAPGGAS